MPSPNARGRDDHLLLVAANVAAIGSLVPVALYQLGVISHLPDPPAKVFDSDRITSSPIAHPLGIPDGMLGIASYGTTLLMAICLCRSKRVSRMLGAKLLLDGGLATFNASRQMTRFGKLCSWCMGAVAATAVMVYAGRLSISRVFANESATLSG